MITSLEAGGAERVLSGLANSWAREGRDVTLITLHHGRADFYELHPRVHRVALAVLRPSSGVVQALTGNLRRLVALRRSIRRSKPELVLAFTDQTNVLTLLATRGSGVPVVVSERTDPEASGLGRPWVWARRLAYQWATRVIVQTESVRRWCEAFLRPTQVVVIPNAVVDVNHEDAKLPPVPTLPPQKLVAGMGSLVPNKGFALLIQVFAGLAAEFPDWDLAILGEGPERRRLE